MRHAVTIRSWAGGSRLGHAHARVARDCKRDTIKRTLGFVEGDAGRLAVIGGGMGEVEGSAKAAISCMTSSLRICPPG
jgi:hypothetical protein